MKKKARLYRMVTDQHICPYGIRSLDLLRRKGFDVEDNHLKTREETDQFKDKHGVKTTPQTFIDEKRIGGFDDLQKYFGIRTKTKGEKSYKPIIAIFSVTFLMALAICWNTEETIMAGQLTRLFVSFSMCVLGILKLKDLDSFVNQFITYDLLGQRVVRYAYLYPFAEVLAGVGMAAQVGLIVVAPIAIFIGTVGAISVIKAVYVDKRELKCACVGGDSSVPLGFISLTENLFMMGMGLLFLF